MLHQNKEKITNAMPRRQTPIHKFPVIAVEEVFLTRGERKAAADPCSNGKYAIENHVTAQVHVLVAVEEAFGVDAVDRLHRQTLVIARVTVRTVADVGLVGAGDEALVLPGGVE